MSDGFSYALAVFLSIVLGFILGVGAYDAVFKPQAIEHGAAMYNSTTGDFEWIDKEGE